MDLKDPHQKNNKLRIGVIFGGQSGEHDVSLMSAQSVMSALDREKYDVIPIGISKEGRWMTGNAFEALSSGESGSHPAALLPDPKASALMQLAGKSVNDAVRQLITDQQHPISGGIIAVSHDGRISMQFNSQGMSRAAADSSGRNEILLGQ